MNNGPTAKIKKKKSRYEVILESSKEFVEKYRLHIGAGLLVVVIGLSIYLLWYEQATSGVEVRIAEIENRLQKTENSMAESSRVASSDATVGVPTESSGEPVSSNSSSSKAATVVPKGKVNINTASAVQLDTLPGIGPAYAGRIIDYRNANGGFKTLEQIQNVKGIGPATYSKIRDLITL